MTSNRTRNLWGIQTTIPLSAHLLWMGVLMISFTACQTTPRTASLHPNILLITVDTLRADHLSCYGYSKPTSPFLDQLAAEGVRFDNAYSASSWTAPSMASIFTGLYPRQHGVRHGVVEDQVIRRQEYLSEQFLTLAEMLRDTGYETFGVFSNGHTSRETGFARGFNHFQMLWFQKSPDPNQVVSQCLPRLTKATKYFLWVHYFDPHAPYTWREEWLQQHALNLDECRLWSNIPMRELRMKLATIRARPAAQQALVDLYDGEIHWCDRHIRELYEMLNAASNTIIIVSADHGEEFLEHNNIGHGENLFEPSIRVPLLIRFPGREHAGKVIATPVANKDIMATLADWLGVSLNQPMPGETLLPLIEQRNTEARPVFFELDRGFDWKGVRQGDWKWLLRARKGKEMLFNLRQDPGEKEPAQNLNPQVALQLRALLETWMAEHPVYIPSPTGPPLNSRQQETLRSLGYLR